MDTDDNRCNCKEYPHIFETSAPKVAFAQPDPGEMIVASLETVPKKVDEVMVGPLEPGEEQRVVLGEHHYLVRRTRTQ